MLKKINVRFTLCIVLAFIMTLFLIFQSNSLSIIIMLLSSFYTLYQGLEWLFGYYDLYKESKKKELKLSPVNVIDLDQMSEEQKKTLRKLLEVDNEPVN